MKVNGKPGVGLAYYKRHPEHVAKHADRRVRIWSGEHGAYWRPNGAGYVSEQAGAGIYRFEEAYRSTRHCGPEKRIAFEFVRAGDVDYVPEIARLRRGLLTIANGGLWGQTHDQAWQNIRDFARAVAGGATSDEAIEARLEKGRSAA